jgi:hypothetical protein
MQQPRNASAATAAVQSIHTGEPDCDLDTEPLILALRAASAYLPQPKLSKRWRAEHGANKRRE